MVGRGIGQFTKGEIVIPPLYLHGAPGKTGEVIGLEVTATGTPGEALVAVGVEGLVSIEVRPSGGVGSWTSITAGRYVLGLDEGEVLTFDLRWEILARPGGGLKRPYGRLRLAATGASGL